MSKRQDLTRILRRLNQHFGKHIRIRWRRLAYLHASVNTVDGIIELEGDERILDPQVLAHEYAHFLVPLPDIKTADFYKWMHPEGFFERYREVCQVLGLPPLLSDIDACKRFARELGM